MMKDDGEFLLFIMWMMRATFWLMAFFGFLFLVGFFVLLAIMGIGGLG
jgi:hypothetical protein